MPKRKAGAPALKDAAKRPRGAGLVRRREFRHGQNLTESTTKKKVFRKFWDSESTLCSFRLRLKTWTAWPGGWVSEDGSEIWDLGLEVKNYAPQARGKKKQSLYLLARRRRAKFFGV